MKYKKAKELVEKSFLDDHMIVKFGWKWRTYPRLRKQMKQWARETLEDEHVKLIKKDVKPKDMDMEELEEAIESLKGKGLIVADGEDGIRITESGCDLAKWLIKNDPFSIDLWKKLGEEENEA